MERKVLLNVEIQTSEAVKASAALQVQIDGLRKSQKDLTKSFNEGEISTEEYSVALTKNKAQVTILSKEQSNFNREIQNSAKAAREAEGSYNQLSAQYSLVKDQLNKMSAAQRLGTNEGIKLEEEAKAIYQQMKNLQEATGSYTLNVGNYENAIRNVLGTNSEYNNTLQGMQERLRTLTELMQGADVGSKAFKDAQNEAGKLRLQIDQALGKVDEFGDREPKNPLKKAYEDAFEASTGLISGLQILNLTMGDNENLAELQAKATMAVAIAQNLQNVAKAKGAIIDTAANVKKEALIVKEKLYALVVGQSTGALKILKIAMASTGVGALVIGLGLLITNFDKVKAAVFKFIPGIEAVSNIIGGIVTKVGDFFSDTTEAQRKAAKDQATTTNIFQKKLDDLNRDLELNGDKYNDLQKKKKEIDRDYYQSYVDISNDEKLTEQEKIKALAQAREKQRRDTLQANKDYFEKENKTKKDADEKANKTKKEANEKALKEQKDADEKNLQRQAEFNQNIEDAEKELRDKRIAAITDENQRRLAEINATEQDELDALYKKYEETKKLGKLTVEDEKAFTDLRNQIIKDAQNEREALTKEEQENSLSGKIAALQKERDLENKILLASTNDRVTINQKKLENELKFQQNVLSLLRTQLSESDEAQQAGILKQIGEVQKIISGIQQQVNAQTAEQGGGAVQKVLGLTPNQLNSAKDALANIQETFNGLQSIISAGFEVRQNEIAAQYQAEEEAINNSSLSEKEKEKKLEALRKKRAMDEYELAKAQFETNQALSITNAIINAAQGVIATFAVPDFTWGVMSGIRIALIAATAAAQIATISSQPPPPKPQFYDGGFTEQTGNPRAKSKMSNSARDVHHNEYIVPWKVLKQGDAMPHIAALESMRKGTFGTLGLRGFADGGYSTRTLENNANNTAEMAVMVAQAVSGVQIVTKVSDINREQRRSVTNRVRAEI